MKRKAAGKRIRRNVKQKPKYVVFVSHSSKDVWIARVIAEKIAKTGTVPWLDEKELRGGDLLGDTIRRGIDHGQESVVLVTPNSIKSQWVLLEIGAVWGHKKRVTPILYGVTFGGLSALSDIKAVELNDLDEFIQQLKQRVNFKTNR